MSVFLDEFKKIVVVEEKLFESMEGRFLRALADVLKEKESVTLPVGKFTLEFRDKGDGGNINVSLKFDKDFIESLNGDTPVNNTISEEFIEKFHDYLYNGMKDSDGNMTDNPIEMAEHEAVYLVCFFYNTLSDVGREFSKEGKTYTVDRIEGVYEFRMVDDEIKVSFNPSKALTHRLKDDSQYK